MSKEDDIRLDQKVRAAWMYYIAGQNQSEIASQLGTSRPVVQRLIAAAKEEGIVSISLHHPVANCLDYAQLLQEKYRLIECNIVPAFNEESTLDSVSFGCYQLMARYLQDDKEKIIGLGSGLTLKKALQRIDFDSQNTRCVALISAMDADGQCNYYDDVPLLLTSKIKAKYYQWPAPRYAQTQEEYDMWCTSRLFCSVSAVARRADVIFVGIGPLGTQSPIFKDGFINQAQMDELTARGGIGEIMGRFIDAEGGVVDSEINRMITSYDIRQSQCPRIAVACGEYKRPAILAALKGGWINGLVTDEHTARWLLTR
ncbi:MULTISPECIES: sugar-binding transcriptional regulator [Klebsiella]|uniref:sugar-binding transcriptional regulator n=1 Tax=Klebsiella TaxID=570 RepID=UPI0009E450D4|nr:MULTISPECIES: sugar-binding domain-containing protein [Klebsiella]OQR48836.1 cytochrome C biogenesis protein CcdA [Klebsiella oxytoca]MBD0902695.1 cytochrome C biogenesis protein CcdA [Klebsiella grimontii]PMT94549.1 cytochrome C biogenesis protein CcdA [Klebsiella sp. Kd70 TUC-EEAOC]QXW41153.1 cytochrome C biogenesis protein CcdA [Klebsiella grimontii]WJI31327.1 helix-turn-helix domain-containing protein [Klebsiella sp. ZYC-1]